MRARILLAVACAALAGAGAALAKPVPVDLHDAVQVAGRPAWETLPAVAATFELPSYAPGRFASLVLWEREASLTVQLFRVDPLRPGFSQTTLEGTPVGPELRLGATDSHVPIRVWLGHWPSGLYYARLQAGRRTGYAPFVLRPARLGTERALVVLPTETWQAYNFRDDDHDGRGDTWYAAPDELWRVPLVRPFLARGVPPHFVEYDLPFLRWYAATGKRADFVASSDLETAGTPAALRAAYRLLVFPGHSEYATEAEYDAVRGFRNLGGNLVFLTANDFFWKVERQGDALVRTYRWRRVGRPEASLIGVQYTRNDMGGRQGPWQVRDTARVPWLFENTGLRPGSRFGHGGIEIDHVAAASPRGTVVLAEIKGAVKDGANAQMTYYRGRSGAQVFAAGAFVLNGGNDPAACQLLQNLWDHLAEAGEGSCARLFPLWDPASAARAGGATPVAVPRPPSTLR